MSNETYTDLENEYFKKKHQDINIEVIKILSKKYPNDSDFGREVRKFLNNNK